MSWRPQASLQALETRAHFNQQIHSFFQSKDVLEVETPILNTYTVTDQHIDSISTEHSRFLHTSPEYAMKRLLAEYQCDIYQLCKVFRANEQGRYHHEEFTMLEWYRVSWNYKDLMREAASLIETLLSDTHELLETHYVSYWQVFKDYLNIDVGAASQSDYLQACTDHSIKLNTSLTIQQYQELVLDQIIVPKLHDNRMTFVYDYPVEQAALAKINTQGYAERFELYLNGFELANGFQELTDGKEQTLRFEENNRKRLQENKNAISIDEKFIDALKAGLPECAGVALGIDRLLMIKLHAKHINEVLAFPVV